MSFVIICSILKYYAIAFWADNLALILIYMYTCYLRTIIDLENTFWADSMCRQWSNGKHNSFVWDTFFSHSSYEKEKELKILAKNSSQGVLFKRYQLQGSSMEICQNGMKKRNFTFYICSLAMLIVELLTIDCEKKSLFTNRQKWLWFLIESNSKKKLFVKIMYEIYSRKL